MEKATEARHRQPQEAVQTHETKPYSKDKMILQMVTHKWRLHSVTRRKLHYLVGVTQTMVCKFRLDSPQQPNDSRLLCTLFLNRPSTCRAPIAGMLVLVRVVAQATQTLGPDNAVTKSEAPIMHGALTAMFSMFRGHHDVSSRQKGSPADTSDTGRSPIRNGTCRASALRFCVYHI